MLIAYIKDIDLELLLFLHHHRPTDTDDIIHNVRQADILQHQIHLAAFDLRHIQHLVDQTQQMHTGNIDLTQTAVHLLRFMQVRPGNRRHTNDRIHRRPDIMRHRRQKIAFSQICHMQRLIRIL